MNLGYVVLTALTALSIFSAVAVATRLEPSGRAEMALVTAMVWNGLIVAPIYLLGLGNHLTRISLGVISALVFVAAAAVASFGRPPHAFCESVLRNVATLARSPFDALGRLGKRRSFVVVPVAFVLVVLVWTAWTSYLAPSWGQWDALWYHEPIIGFTIQNHGFAFVDLPNDAQKVNGYPRLCEMTQLWFVIFTDRRLIEVLNSLFSPALLVGVYLLVRRYTNDETVALGWGAALLLMPATANLLQTIYVDVQTAAFIVAGVYFATKPKLRLRDGGMAALTLTLAVGSKFMALVPVAILSVVTAFRLFVRRDGNWKKSLAVVVAGAAFICAMAACTYLRNYLKYHNPFWPDLKYDNAKWNIHWPGNIDWGAGNYNEDVRRRLNMNIPMKELLEDLYRIPWSVNRASYGQDYDYGFVVSYLIIPFTLVALTVAVVEAVLGMMARSLRWTWPRPRENAGNLLLVAAPMVFMLYMSPALWAARYNIAPVGIAMVCVAWLTAHRGFSRVAEASVSIAGFGMIVMFFWTQPRWWYWPDEAAKLASIPYPEREVTPASLISPTMYHARGSAILRDVGLAREAEIGAGDVVGFPDNYGGFVALFWNNRFSNRVVWVPTDDYVQGLNRVNAKWAYCAYADSACYLLRSPGSGWEEIGTLNDEAWGAVFRHAHAR